MEHQKLIEITHKVSNCHFAHTSEARTRREDYYRHSHTRYELYIFFGSDVNFVIEDRIFAMTPGTMLLIPPHTYHYAALGDSDKPYNRVVINFERMFIYPEIHSLLDSGKNPFAWDFDKYDPLLSDLEESLATHMPCDKPLLLHMFLNRILLDMKYMQDSAQRSHTLNPTVSQILAYINEHINEPLNLQVLAEHVFLNQSYMSQLFSSYMKIGIMDYVKQKKIYLAKELISNENVPPTEASKRLGFADYSTFYRLYKKYLQESPSDK